MARVGSERSRPMESMYTPEAEEFRREVKQFLSSELGPDWRGVGSLDAVDARGFVEEWRSRLYKNGLLGLNWPVEYGGQGRSNLEVVVFAEECAKYGVPAGTYSDVLSIKLFGNTLLRWGNEDQKRRFLPRILSGEDRWCQGFSEPDAGSDLAGLRTHAEIVESEWRINGTKIWTSLGHEANWMFLLARTDVNAPKHQGLTFLMCPMHQEGVEVRQIKMMSGKSEFCEVSLSAARTASTNMLGDVGEGWSVTATLLGHERGEDAAVHPILFRQELDRLFQMAAERGKNKDPVIRDGLARCYAKVEVMRFLGYRTLTAMTREGAELGPEASISKLYWSEYHKDVTSLAVSILGPDALVPNGRPPARPVRSDDPGTPNSSASWVGALYNAVAGTIDAGSSEIQRKILSESVLGLPRDGARDAGKS